MPTKNQKAAFIFIFVTVVLDMIAVGIMAPVLPKLITQFKDGDLAAAARVTGVFGFVWAAMQFIFSPIIGSLSDRFGRRPVVLLSNLGLGLDYLFMAVAPSIGLLFVGRILSGITAASFSTAAAYIADVTPAENRAAKFGMLGAAFGLGFVIGPAIGGFLGDIDLRLPFWVAAGLSLANFAYGYFVLPESLPVERRAPFRWKRANPLGSIKHLTAHPGLLGLVVATFLFYFAHEAHPSIFVLYTDARFQWSSKTVGLVLMVVGVTSMIVSALGVGPIVEKLGERRAVVVGLGFGALAFAIYGLAPTGSLFAWAIPIGAIGGIAGPAMQSLMTKNVSPSEQGQLQGALASLRGITGMIGPLLFTQVLSASIVRTDGSVPLGASYLLAGAFFVASLIVTMWNTRARVATVTALVAIGLFASPAHAKKPDYNQLGFTLYQAQKYPEALKQFDAAIKKSPKFALAWLNRARTKAAINQKRVVDDYCDAEQNWILDALADLAHALDLNPTVVKAKLKEPKDTGGLALVKLPETQQLLKAWDYALPKAWIYRQLGSVATELTLEEGGKVSLSATPRPTGVSFPHQWAIGEKGEILLSFKKATKPYPYIDRRVPWFFAEGTKQIPKRMLELESPDSNKPTWVPLMFEAGPLLHDCE